MRRILQASAALSAGVLRPPGGIVFRRAVGHGAGEVLEERRRLPRPPRGGGAARPRAWIGDSRTMCPGGRGRPVGHRVGSRYRLFNPESGPCDQSVGIHAEGPAGVCDVGQEVALGCQCLFHVGEALERIRHLPCSGPALVAVQGTVDEASSGGAQGQRTLSGSWRATMPPWWRASIRVLVLLGGESWGGHRARNDPKFSMGIFELLECCDGSVASLVPAPA